MRSVAMDVFAMPEVTVEGETYDCVILAVDRHSGYIVAAGSASTTQSPYMGQKGGTGWAYMCLV